jgi:hypothetical protein
MGTIYGHKIVTDGLILYLDAGNPKSYPGSGTDFYDLSGNGNHHIIVAAPTYNSSPGSFTLNGSTQGFSKSSALSGSTSTCTVCLFYKTVDITELWVRGNQSSGYYLSASNNNNYYHGNCGTPTNYVDLNTVTNPYTSGYKDGDYHYWEAKNVVFSSWTYYEWWLYSGGWLMAGDSSIIMVYDRVLTADESLQNYNALKGRFI